MMEFQFLQQQGDTDSWWLVTADMDLETMTYKRRLCQGANEDDLRLFLNEQDTLNEMAQPNRKGATAETEIMAMLQVAVEQVYTYFNSQITDSQLSQIQAPDLRRKDLLKGWHDISGIPWLAPEVKHHAVMSRPQWWRQCVDQAEASGGEPVLFYKITRKTGLLESGKWHVQTYMMKSPGKGAPMLKCPCIVPIEDWMTYFKNKLLWKLQNEPF